MSRYDRETNAVHRFGLWTQSIGRVGQYLVMLLVFCVAAWIVPTAWLAWRLIYLVAPGDPNDHGWATVEFALATLIGGLVLYGAFWLWDLEYRLAERRTDQKKKKASQRGRIS